MALHNIRGKQGELLAETYLSSQGYHVQQCNWRYGYYEIDIIATVDHVIHFIEVKTRHTATFGHPEESVSRKKFTNLKKAAECFLELNPYWKHIAFDILSITIDSNHHADFYLIEDVYF